MPKGFDKCRAAGGKIRTVSGGTPAGRRMGLKKDQYMHVCIDKQGGFHRGYAKANHKLRALARRGR